jgi:hypothetical protein
LPVTAIKWEVNVMFAQLFRRLPALFKTFAVATGIVIVATMSTAGGGLASTDPNVEVGDTVENPLAEMCDAAVETFFREIDWILAHSHLEPDDPRMARHRDSMWDAWAFAEFTCRIDVGGDGEIG